MSGSVQVMVFNVETGRYAREYIPEMRSPDSEFSDQQLKLNVERLDHNSELPSMACRTAFHPGGGRQRW